MATYERKDRFYKLAKERRLPSRASFKLEEILDRFKLFKPGATVLDLGAAPGGWTLLLAKSVGPKGRVLAIDLAKLDRKMPEMVEFLQADLQSDQAKQWLGERLATRKAQAIFSDMSPKLIGIPFRDAYLSYELGVLAFEMAKQHLAFEGSLIMKIFPGEELEGFMKTLRSHFKNLKSFEPVATRKTSKEIYLIAQGFKGEK